MARAVARRHRGPMFIPLLSVSAIGAAVALRRQGAAVGTGPLLGAGLAGAWIGFLLGGAVGVVADVVLFGGFWPVLLGHVGALAMARTTVRNRGRAALPSG